MSWRNMQQNLKLQFGNYIPSSPFFLDPLGVRAQIIRCGGDHRNERLAKVNFTLVFLLSCYMLWRYQYTNVPREVTTFLLCPKSKFQLKEKKRHLLLVRAHHSGINPRILENFQNSNKKTFSMKKGLALKYTSNGRYIQPRPNHFFCKEKPTKREWRVEGFQELIDLK